MARRRQFQGHTSSVPHKEWSAALKGQIVGMDIAEGVVGVGDGALAVALPFTILRTRGRVMLELNTAGAGERVVCAVGITVAGDRAVAAGVASLPGPQSQGEAPWLWHDYLTVSSGSEAAVISEFLVDRVTLDSKAMRKVRDDQTLVLMAEISESADMGGTVNLMYACRILTGA